MSLDITITVPGKPACAACGHGATETECVLDWNYTYNVSPMLGAAAKAVAMATAKEVAAINEPIASVLFGTTRMLDGIEGRASDAAPKVAALLAELERYPATYSAMNPANGWGSYDGIVRALRELLAALIEHPDGMVETWR